MKILLAGQSLELLPDRAVYWPEQRAILVADVHLGKDQLFRRRGLAVPTGVLDQDLDRLSALIASRRTERLIILGDWVHAPPAEGDTWPERIAEWRAQHPATAIDLVLGNHDRKLDPWLAHWQMAGHRDTLELAGLSLVHEWQADRTLPGLSGHLHPGARLRTRREQLMLPAFLVAENHLVLPAFGRFTGLADPTPFPWQQRYVTSGRTVFELPG